MDGDHKMWRGDIRRFGALGADGWEDSLKNESEAENFLKQMEMVLEKHGVLLRDTPILEIGTGQGYLLQQLKKHGYNVFGVDARARGTEKGRLVEARIEQLPFLETSFGVLLAVGVFDPRVYSQDQHSMMKEISRLLKPEGVFFTIGAMDVEEKSSPENFGFHLISDADKKSFYRIYRKK